MALADIFLAVTNQCTAVLTAAGQSALVPAYAFGDAQKKARNLPPRIAWTFEPEQYRPPKMQSSTHGGLAGMPRALRSRVLSINVEIWGPNLVFSPMSMTGSMKGTITLSGTPVSMVGLAFKIIAAGAPGAATFQYSLDSGQTWSGTLTTGAAVVLGASGITAAFTGSFAAADYFWCVAHDQLVADYATTEYLLNAFLASVHSQLRGFYELSRGEWLYQESELMIDGKSYALGLTLEVPVLEMATPAIGLAKVTSLPQTDTIGQTTTTP